MKSLSFGVFLLLLRNDHEVSGLSVPRATSRCLSTTSSPNGIAGARASAREGTALFRREGLFWRTNAGSTRPALSTALSSSPSAYAGTSASDLALGDNVPSEERPFKTGPEVTFGSSGLKLNVFGALYASVAVGLGIFWWLALTGCQLMYRVFGEKFDRLHAAPVYLSQLWGETLMAVTGCYPKITGRENVQQIYDGNKGKKSDERTPIMFVANHCSWIDIPFIGAAIGWRNYKIIAKQELLKVPVLSKSIRTGGNVVLDRTNRRSQFETFKRGVKYLKDGVNLVTFPEGTRSRTGRMGPFKKGAFKMAQHQNAPIVPVSIRYAHKVQPIEYVFPARRSGSIPASVHIGKPIYTDGKSDEEVMNEVWTAIAENLPESQKPQEGTPSSA